MNTHSRLESAQFGYQAQRVGPVLEIEKVGESVTPSQGDPSGSGSVTTVFYSGTGNSYRVATWMHALAETLGREARLVSIEQLGTRGGAGAGEASLLNLVFPTHGFTTPWAMIKAAVRLGRGRGTPAFVVATRAGIKLGRIHPPGLSGTATFLVALILFCKGYRVRGSLSVNMPSNWFSLHPIQKRRNLDAIAERGREIVDAVTRKVLDGRRHWLTLNNLYEFVFGLALLPVSLAYIVYGRFFLAKLFFANSQCEECGVCARDCPVQAIRIHRGRPYWTYACESCMRCAGYCPKNAVEAGHSWGFILYFLTTVPAAQLLLASIGTSLHLGSTAHGLVARLVDLVYIYVALFVPYALFASLIRLRPVNWLFAKTTLTHYWGRYREAQTKPGDLTASRRS